MKRRSFLQFLGLAPAAPVLAKLPLPSALPVVAAAPIIEQVVATEGPEIVGACSLFTTACSMSCYEHPGRGHFLVDLD